MKQSAGIVFIYYDKILLVHPTSSKWFETYSFPKGQLDENETVLKAAIRETYEEIGMNIDPTNLSDECHEILYTKKGKIYKKLYYFVYNVKSLRELDLDDTVVPKNQLQLSEIDWAGFLDYEEAKKRIHPLMAEVLNHIKKEVKNEKV